MVIKTIQIEGNVMQLSKNLYYNEFAHLVEIQDSINTVHPIFSKYYPVAIVSDGVFEIYDINLDKREYQYIKSEPCQFLLPEGVRAAFPLESFDNKMSAIVSNDVFDTQDGYVAILHEFVHCAQFYQCEIELKNQMSIAQHYRMKNDYMWEINHFFPYTNQDVADMFSLYMTALSKNDYAAAINRRQQLNCALGLFDREYMLWQEWKEGLARFLENKIRNRLGLNENHCGREKPFDRVSFYESGSRLISLIEKADPQKIFDIRKLFYEMKNTQS
jgi:hypothetical protein